MKEDLFAYMDAINGQLTKAASNIWQNPEKALEEVYACDLQIAMLEKAGFKINRNIPGMSTAFVAEFGQGSPVLGVLGEYDALPGLSQQVSGSYNPIKEQENGHGCGHNLLGVAGIGAVLAIRELLEQDGFNGTVRYYGCPAEETLTGKVIMAKEGVFNDLDACLTWHPASMNTVLRSSFLAMQSALFKFSGISSHAAAAPEMGRSALDAVELMNVGANYLREHIIDKARINYTITKGGGPPNIIPANAESWYYVRAPEKRQIEDIFQRLVKISQGAALMTETGVEHEVIAGCYNVLGNNILGDLLHENMKTVGAPRFTDADRTFARELVKSFPEGQQEKVIAGYFGSKELEGEILHADIVQNDDEKEVMPGSTDVGDVSWIVPLAQFTAATWPIGTAAHSWQATAASGSGIGFTAMLFSAKVIAGTLYDLLGDKKHLLNKIKSEFKIKTSGQAYQPLVTKTR
ncbi:MAG: amidohydrolase [Deltaproteobacteria bacterium]|jgi:aminobenzoyl-glutamate utilization protein B|nr:amidohydrolase [Deltaproteobacteria bacterium]MBT4091671.1 amidohydrolase [Deltaproteobacteria bacterium]MBT4266566.1 amidohydrolase [Deltaproteobacteria bacterium]MBT4639041.1 amidohydrolase [Deltaproteobacteria bacterium]MBT6500273.1 amidohydrolase [Deltaproteobacteria bacterium]